MVKLRKNASTIGLTSGNATAFIRFLIFMRLTPSLLHSLLLLLVICFLLIAASPAKDVPACSAAHSQPSVKV
jgi:hypothetical protein